MKKRKAVGPDEVPVKVWIILGDVSIRKVALLPSIRYD